MALSAAGDDGLNSILGGILGAGVGGGHAYDEVLGSFGLDTGGMIGGIVTGLDEFLIRGGDGKDTISGDALASGKTGIAEANNKATTAATLDGGESFAASSAGHAALHGGIGRALCGDNVCADG